MDKNYFSELAAINVNDHVEKKGRFIYLSWPWAVDTLLKRHPDATWEVAHFEHNDCAAKVPYLQTPMGTFVEVSVTVNGITRSQVHPVLNNNNKPIQEPTVFDINTSIQRALVKAMALHGLGLYIYAGEDLPLATDEWLRSAESLDELHQIWSSLTKRQQHEFSAVKDEVKARIAPPEAA